MTLSDTLTGKLAGAWMSAPGTEAVFGAIQSGGYQVFFVGGCVRNALLQQAVCDLDLATDAPPAEVMRLAKSAGLKVIPTGFDHGTVTIVADGVAYEVTTFRRDVKTDGRRAVVAFSTRIEEDAARRDFTMNALYAQLDGTVLDPLGGWPDLVARRVRFVGDPQTRITEDALRILRFFRFHAHFGDPGQGIDAEGLAACAALQHLVDGLSLERIGHEMRRLLAAADPAPAVASMAFAGILARILPGSDATGLAPLVHLDAGFPMRWQRRLLVLGGSHENLRLSRGEAKQQDQMRAAMGQMLSPAVLGTRLGLDLAIDVLLARQALMGGTLPQDWQDEALRGSQALFPIAAADLPELQGPALGLRLKQLRAAWEASNLTMSKADLLQKHG